MGEMQDSKIETLRMVTENSRQMNLTLDEHLRVQNDLIAITMIVEEYLKVKKEIKVEQDK